MIYVVQEGRSLWVTDLSEKRRVRQEEVEEFKTFPTLALTSHRLEAIKTVTNDG